MLFGVSKGGVRQDDHGTPHRLSGHVANPDLSVAAPAVWDSLNQGWGLWTLDPNASEGQDGYGQTGQADDGLQPASEGAVSTHE